MSAHDRGACYGARSTLAAMACLVAWNGPVHAQAVIANDPVFRRAQRLVSEGNGAAGRAVVDSVLAATVYATLAGPVPELHRRLRVAGSPNRLKAELQATTGSRCTPQTARPAPGRLFH